jgi:hypothetical protein
MKHKTLNTEETANSDLGTGRRSLPLTNQKLWEMAKVITDRQKKAKEHPTNKVDWDMLEGMWFDWLEEELFGNDANDGAILEVVKMNTQHTLE